MKPMNAIKKYASKVVYSTPLLVVGHAFAAVPAGVTAEGDAIKADIIEIGAYGVIAALVLMGFAYMRRSAK